MSLNKDQQELLDQIYPDGYEIKKITLEHNNKVIDQADHVHILFVKIINRPGQRENTVIPSVQVMSIRDFDIMKAAAAKYSLKAITQQNEYSVIHHPSDKKPVEKEPTAAEKQEAANKKRAETIARKKAEKAEKE